MVDTVALAAATGGEQLERTAAACWLRQRATSHIRITDLQPHHHRALVIATTRGWTALAPPTGSELGFTLRRYDAAGDQDSERGDWRISVIEASVARNAAAAVAPSLSGASLSSPAAGLPFLAAGSIKLVYDGLLFVMFRDVHPPEER